MFGGPSWDMLPTVVQLIFVDQTLELAGSIDLTPHAVVRVACQQPLHIGSTKCAQFIGVGYDTISLLGLRHTGRLWAGLALDIDETHAAHGVRRQTGVVAKRRNMNAGRLGGVEQSQAIIDLDRSPINRKSDHIGLSDTCAPQAIWPARGGVSVIGGVVPVVVIVTFSCTTKGVPDAGLLVTFANEPVM